MKKMKKINRNSECSISYCVSGKIWIIKNGLGRVETFFEKWFQMANPYEARNLALQFGKQYAESIKLNQLFFDSFENTGNSNAQVERRTTCDFLDVAVEAFDEKTGKYFLVSDVGYKSNQRRYGLPHGLFGEYNLYLENGYQPELVSTLEDDFDGSIHPIIALPEINPEN